MIIADEEKVSFANLSLSKSHQRFQRRPTLYSKSSSVNSDGQILSEALQKQVIRLKRSEMHHTTMKEGWKIHQI